MGSDSPFHDCARCGKEYFGMVVTLEASAQGEIEPGRFRTKAVICLPCYLVYRMWIRGKTTEENE